MKRAERPKRPSRRAPARAARPPARAPRKAPARATKKAPGRVSQPRGVDEVTSLRRDLKEALDRQSAVAEILRAISTSPSDVQPVLDAIATNATRYCGAEDAFVYLVSGDQYVERAHEGPIPTSGALPDVRRDMVMGRAILERTIVHVPDLLAAESAVEFPTGSGIARRTGFHAALAAPLVRDRDVVGVIGLRRRAAGPFSDHQLALVRTFAEQAVIAIENVRLFNETKEALEQQQAISEILEVISRSPSDLQPVFDAVIDRAFRLCEADNATLLRRTADGFVSTARTGRPMGEDERAFMDRFIPGPRAPERETLTGRVLLERATVRIDDALTDPEYFVRRAGIQPEELPSGFGRSLIGVPLIQKDEVVGVILVRRLEIRPFSDRDQRLLEAFAAQAVIAIENVRLFNETKEALERQTALSEILRVIASSPDNEQPVLQTIAESATRFCGAADAAVLLVDGPVIRPVAHHGPIPIFPEKPLLFDRTAISGRAIMERRTVHVGDILGPEGDEYPQARGRVEPTGQRAILAAPLIREGAGIGVLMLRKTEPVPFTQAQIDLVEAFADQAVIAISNVRLFNETRDSLERQTAVSEILKVISSSPDSLQPVLDAIASATTKFCGAEDAAVLLVRDGVAQMLAHYGSIDEGARTVALDPQTVTGTAILDRRTVHVEDVTAVSDFPASAEISRSDGQRTVLATPLMRSDEAIGVILLRRKEPRAFTPRQVELVETFADQAVIAIENVRLFNETKESLEQQTAVAAVLQTISRSAFDLEPVLHTVVENAARLSEADAAWMTKVEGSDLVISTLARYGHSADGRDLDLRLQGPPPHASRHTERAETTSIMGRPVVERRSVTSTDLPNDPELRDSTWAIGIGARSVLGVPMIREGFPIGVLVVARHHVRPFTDREIKLVETFADQAAIAIENVRLFNEIHEKSRQLEVASRHKSEFLANMSHELRTPLNAIIGFTDVMLQEMFGPLNEKQKEYLADVRGSGEHLLSLINDILDLSKIEAGRVQLEPAEFSLEAAIDNALTLVRERAARHAITLASDVASDVGTVVADERKVKQVVVNLLTNAVKFTPDGGWVGITARCDDDHVTVAVRDTGIGIAPEDQAKVFEEFQQVGKDPDRSREGTGLGLTLSKRFVELHGGRIWVESEVGKGSTFTFTIPLRQAADRHEVASSV